MVARINSGKSIAKALNYNEQKLKLGKAECLHAENFLKDTEKLNFYDKLRHFERLTSLNERTTTNTFHVSLNFDPSEKLSNEKLNDIAKEYMQKIGFEKQPFRLCDDHKKKLLQNLFIDQLSPPAEKIRDMICAISEK